MFEKDLLKKNMYFLKYFFLVYTHVHIYLPLCVLVGRAHLRHRLSKKCLWPPSSVVNGVTSLRQPVLNRCAIRKSSRRSRRTRC